MNNKVNYIGTENNLTVLFVETSKVYNIDDSHPNWTTILAKLSDEDYEGLEELLSVKKVIETYVSDSGVEVDEIGVKYNGQYIDNYLTTKIVDFAKRGLPVKPLVKFFEKVMQNPSRRAVNELYKFLEHGQMPITPDGNFLGYKSVSKEFKDWHTGKYDNSIGNSLSMPRNEVCDDPNEGCSYGFHVGTLDYAKSFNSTGKLIIVEVNPADVVSVPHDCNNQKLRTAKYSIVAEFERPLDNDFSDDYNQEDEDEDERTDEDIQGEIDEWRRKLANGSHLFTPDQLRDIVEEVGDLEQELQEWEDLHACDTDDDDDDDDEDEGNCGGYVRDEKGRFRKKS